MDRFVDLLTVISVIAPVVYFAVMFRSPRVSAEERGRLRPYVVLFLASTVFNFILFQAYSTMMLLAVDERRDDDPRLRLPRQLVRLRARRLRGRARARRRRASGPGWATASRTPPTRSRSA